MKTRILRMGQEYGGEITATFAVPHAQADDIHALIGVDVSVEVKKWREKRSLTQNAYAWVLITKIAQCISPPMSKEDVYVDMLKHYGQGGMVTVIKDKADDILRAFDYYEITGEKEAKGKAFLTVKVFVGSSKYDSGEMATFIDGIVQVAKDLKIETMTPQEIARLENV
jgi:hypothetical protein